MLALRRGPKAPAFFFGLPKSKIESAAPLFLRWVMTVRARTV